MKIKIDNGGRGGELRVTKNDYGQWVVMWVSRSGNSARIGGLGRYGQEHGTFPALEAALLSATAEAIGEGCDFEFEIESGVLDAQRH